MQRPSFTLPAVAKRIAFSLTYVLVAVMAAATFIEKPLGHAALADHVYGAWWFAVLWAALTVSALLFFLSRRRPLHSVVLHLSFVVILLGALTTSLTATRGQLHLRVGQSARSFQLDGPGAPRYAALPATVELTDFDVVRHAGTQAPADYVSHLTVRYADGIIMGSETIAPELADYCRESGLPLLPYSAGDLESGAYIDIYNDFYDKF